MAAKFVALLLFVCAAQANMYARARPGSGSPQATTLEANALDLSKVAGPVAAFHAQVLKIRENIHSRVPARFQEYAMKGQEIMQEIKGRIQDLIAKVQAQAQQIQAEAAHSASSEESAENDRAKLISAIAVKCAQNAEAELERIAEFARNLLQEKTFNLMKDVNEELQPLAAEIQRQTEEAMENIQKTVERVKELIAAGQAEEAKNALNEGRTNLDNEVTAMIMQVQAMQEDYPQLAAEAEIMGKEYYQATFEKATGLFAGVQQCIAQGIQNLA